MQSASSTEKFKLVSPVNFYSTLIIFQKNQVPPPKCRLMGCTGPLANDGDIAPEGRTGSAGAGGRRRECHQTFVPLNGCWASEGERLQRFDIFTKNIYLGTDAYPVGMVCTICCECSEALASEMRRSRGWASGYRRS